MIFHVDLYIDKELEYSTFVDAPDLEGAVDKLESQEHFDSLEEVSRDKIDASKVAPDSLFIHYKHADNGNSGVVEISRPYADAEGAAFMIQDLIHTPTNNSDS